MMDSALRICEALASEEPPNLQTIMGSFFIASNYHRFKSMGSDQFDWIFAGELFENVGVDPPFFMTLVTCFL